MSKYSCVKCNMEFKKKSLYKIHNIKDLCIINNDVTEIKENNEIINKVQNGKELEFTEFKIIKPILKWLGGKTQILNKLIVEFPNVMNNYHEIFLGGGSVLLTLLSYVKNNIIKVFGNIYAYDINEPLINTYKNIQSNHNELYEEIQKIIIEFNSCSNDGILNRKSKNIEEAKQLKENYYYWIRNEYNKLSEMDKKKIIGSAMFIFLNKTCFRGIFRTGKNGFNVPFGHYKNPEIINKEHLDEISYLIKNVIFKCRDFNKSLKKIKENDFAYLDPPYYPEKNNSFVGYTKNGFDIENHNNLFNSIHLLTQKNIKVLLSNSDVIFVRENFKNEKYNINSLLCKRSINSKNPESKTNEVIIKNY